MNDPLQPARILGPAVVTGGGQGLGRAFCHALAARGAAVVVADINLENARRVADEITAVGRTALPIHADVTDLASVEAMAAEVASILGTPAVLVNNAALFSPLKMKPYVEISLEEWRRVLDVNVIGAFVCCRVLGPMMAAKSYGKIINISSATVWTGRAGYLHYVTSKAALLGLTRALASELGPSGVRVNAITPGSTQTEIERETITHEARQAMAASTALRRIEVPADIAGAVLFLASTDSDFITGQTINVDGGFAFH